MYLIDVISTFSIIVPAVAGALLFKKVPRTLKILCLYIFAALLTEAFIFILSYNGANNLFLFHLFTYLEYTSVALIFYSLAYSKLWKWIIVIVSLGFILYSVINVIFYESIFEFNSNQRYVQAIIIIVFCVGYFVELLRNVQHMYLERHPYFVFASSYLIYISGTIFLFLFSKDFMGNAVNKYWAFHGVLNIWLNLSYVAVLWLGRKI